MSPRRSWFLRGLMSCFLVFCGCGRSVQRVVARENEAKPDTVAHLRDANDAGRFIAGLPGTAGSPFATLEATGAWSEHRRRLDETWRKADASLISGLQEFQRAELSDPLLQSSPVFYPFGGPDALTLTLCFPQSPTYIMVGLEPAGTLPKLSQIEARGVPKYLVEMRETVASELGRSFFVTRQMDHQLRGQVTDGVLLPILHLLVRMHNTVLGLRYIRLDDQGSLTERPTIGRQADSGIRASKSSFVRTRTSRFTSSIISR